MALLLSRYTSQLQRVKGKCFKSIRLNFLTPQHTPQLLSIRLNSLTP